MEQSRTGPGFAVREPGRQPRRARESTRARRDTVRRTFWVFTAALAVACLAAGARVARPAGGVTVTIGISLSGDFSDSGKAAMRRYQRWASVVNAHGGLESKQVTLKIVDDTSSPTQVV